MFLGFVWDLDSGWTWQYELILMFRIFIDLTNLQAGSKYAKHEPSIPEYPNQISFDTVYVYV